jgi:hypothetical protein
MMLARSVIITICKWRGGAAPHPCKTSYATRLLSALNGDPAWAELRHESQHKERDNRRRNKAAQGIAARRCGCRQFRANDSYWIANWRRGVRKQPFHFWRRKSPPSRPVGGVGQSDVIGPAAPLTGSLLGMAGRRPDRSFPELARSDINPHRLIRLFSTYSSNNGIPTTPFSGVFTYSTIDLEVFGRGPAGIAGQGSPSHLGEQGSQFWVHVREPFRVGLSVGIEVVEASVFHLIVAPRVGQRVVGLSEIPFASRTRDCERKGVFLRDLHEPIRAHADDFAGTALVARRRLENITFKEQAVDLDTSDPCSVALPHDTGHLPAAQLGSTRLRRAHHGCGEFSGMHLGSSVGRTQATIQGHASRKPVGAIALAKAAAVGRLSWA